MTKKDLHAEVRKLWGKYSKILHLTEFKPEFKIDDNIEAMAQVSVSYPYKSPLVTLNSIKLIDAPKEEREQVMIHEFIHLLTNPLYAKATTRYVSRNEVEDEREALTDHLTSIVYDLVYGGKK